MLLTRRKIQLILGGLWFLDGCLQLQSKMFSSSFISGVVDPAKAGQPGYIASPIHLAASVFLTHPAVFNSLIAATQVVIGLLIIRKSSTKLGLYLSFLWGLFVWFFGEAAAGLFSGHSSLLVGLPGAALLYAIISLAVLPKGDDNKQPADYWLTFVWSAVWLIGAIFELLPAQHSVTSLSMMIGSNASGAPGWLARIDNNTANRVGHLSKGGMSMSMMSGSTGYLEIVILAVIMAAIGLGVLFSKASRLSAVSLGIVLSLFFWIVGQSLGGYYTGQMTDVQSAPLFILLGLAVISQPDLNLKLKAFYLRINRFLV